MRDLADIAELLKRDPTARDLLAYVERLGLPDCWIGAGFVRNAVWDVLHGRPPYTIPLNDVDVLFFDPADVRWEREASIERQLQALAPGFNWSVKNQARMHLRNGDAPYRDICDALSCWCETPTAIAARSVEGQVEFIAPFGVEDLLGLVVRPTPHFAVKLSIYRQRVREKDWRRPCPKLTVYEG